MTTDINNHNKEKRIRGAVIPPATPSPSPASTTVKAPEENKESIKNNPPGGLSINEHDYLRKSFTDDIINKAYSPFGFSEKDHVLTNIFRTFTPKPTEPDKKKMRNMQTLGTIGDALGLIYLMVAAQRGAHLPPINHKNSASAQLNQKVQKLQENYQAKMEKYKQQENEMLQKDYLRSKDSYDALREQMQQQLESYHNQAVQKTENN